jgi:hypothetical protein
MSQNKGFMIGIVFVFYTTGKFIHMIYTHACAYIMSLKKPVCIKYATLR